MLDLADIAGLFADRTRARMLDELMSGGALRAGVLASRARVAPSTASKHLAKLEAGGLVTVTSRGRTREVRLAGPEVAEAIEALGRLAAPRPPRGLREATRMDALRCARSCYDHLAGQTGVRLTDALVASGALRVRDGGFALAPDHPAWARLGVDVAAVREGAGRRPVVRSCLDWTERRPHLAGALGAAVLGALLSDGSVRRLPGGRALAVTPAGQRRLDALAS